MAYCPDCGSDFTRRIARSPTMRLIFTSRRILCSDCGVRSLILFPALARRRALVPVQRAQAVKREAD
jgi:DNA-directed RNA polymerase subunit RPC12/RpoP